MNLMFWKKKTGVENEAEDARENLPMNAKPLESLDFAAAKQEAAAPQEPQSFDDGETTLEAPAKQGWFARMKLRLNALLRHFRKPAAFRAEEDRVPEESGDPEEADDTTYTESDLELDAPAKPGLSVRIKLQIISLLRRFRKAPAQDADEEHGGATEGDGESPEPSAPGKAGLLLRIKAAFTAFFRELKAPAAAAAADQDEEAGSRDRSEAAPEDVQPTVEPVRSRKWLVIGGSVVIMILLLFSIAIANWPIFEPSPKRWGTRHDITSISSRPIPPEALPGEAQAPAPEGAQAEIEALMQKNAELQSRINMLKSRKSPPQQMPYAPSAVQIGDGSPALSASGDMVVGNKDPKATAMSLKEAIEAMNAGTGGYEKKSAK